MSYLFKHIFRKKVHNCSFERTNPMANVMTRFSKYFFLLETFFDLVMMMSGVIYKHGDPEVRTKDGASSFNASFKSATLVLPYNVQNQWSLDHKWAKISTAGSSPWFDDEVEEEEANAETDKGCCRSWWPETVTMLTGVTWAAVEAVTLQVWSTAAVWWWIMVTWSSSDLLPKLEDPEEEDTDTTLESVEMSLTLTMFRRPFFNDGQSGWCWTWTSTSGTGSRTSILGESLCRSWYPSSGMTVVILSTLSSDGDKSSAKLSLPLTWRISSSSWVGSGSSCTGGLGWWWIAGMMTSWSETWDR